MSLTLINSPELKHSNILTAQLIVAAKRHRCDGATVHAAACCMGSIEIGQGYVFLQLDGEDRGRPVRACLDGALGVYGLDLFWPGFQVPQAEMALPVSSSLCICGDREDDHIAGIGCVALHMNLPGDNVCACYEFQEALAA